MKIRILIALIAFLGAIAPVAAAERVINIFNWSDYIDPGVLADFTRESGIKVIYDTYDSNEMLEARMLAGATGYDVVVPSGPLLQRLVRADVLQALDRRRLSNAGNLWPEIDRRLQLYDPGGAHAVDYAWFTTGVAYNESKIIERIGKPITSWDEVLRADALKKFADCAVYMLDSPEDMLAIALNYLKLDPNSKNPNDLRRAADVLGGLRRYVKKFHSSEYINALANGDICLAIGWAGDAMQARNRAREAGADVNIVFTTPVEGGMISLDALAIPVDAPHLNEAYVFIDYLLRPDVAARNVRATNFASGVLPARKLLEPAIGNNPAIYPDDKTMLRLFAVTAPDQPTQKLITRLWTMVKTGR
jgi:putrescine transport system substrate-binding protein